MGKENLSGFVDQIKLFQVGRIERDGRYQIRGQG